MDINRVTLIGNVTRDPETRTLKSGLSVARFGFATSRTYRVGKETEKEETTFHSIVAWSRLGAVVSQYVKKGSHLYIEGHIRNYTYEDKAGEKRSGSEVVASQVVMLGHLNKAKQGKDAEALATIQVDREDLDPEAA